MVTDVPKPWQFAALRVGAVTFLRIRRLTVLQAPIGEPADHRPEALDRPQCTRDRARRAPHHPRHRRTSGRGHTAPVQWPVHCHSHGQPGVLATAGRIAAMIPRFSVPFGAKELSALALPHDMWLRTSSGASPQSSALRMRLCRVRAHRPMGVPPGSRRSQRRGRDPGYTCSIVAHAVTLSGNTPVFVDISLDDYDPTPGTDSGHDHIARPTPSIATNTLGYPQDADSLRAVVTAAENRFGHKIWLIQACAHAFGATSGGDLVATAGGRPLSV